MKQEEKQDYFKTELTYLKIERYQEDFKYLISNLPSYFFHIAASSTGKYHPSYALGEGGLLRHTKAAVRIAHELLEDPIIGDKYTEEEKELMIIALCIHDGLKLGKTEGKYTVFTHPLLAGEYIKENKDHLHFTDEEIDFLYHVIASLMGPWNKDYDGNEVLPVPHTKYENFVHMCDFLASRKCLLLEFDSNNEILG